jgi:hypothetical protein
VFFRGKVLYFNDRLFYHDWWNSSDVSAYWRLWNSECCRGIAGRRRFVAEFLISALALLFYVHFFQLPFTIF